MKICPPALPGLLRQRAAAQAQNFCATFRIGVLLAALALAACGGGSGDSTTLAPDAGQVSEYGANGGFRNGRAIAFSVFDGGLVYAFYQSDLTAQPFPIYAYAGFFVGKTTDSGRSRTYQGTDFDFDASTAYPSVLSLTFNAPNTSAGGQLTHLGTADTTGDAVYGAYSSVSTEPTTATIAGPYTAYVRTVAGGIPAMQATVDASGRLTVVGGGCNVVGSLAARPSANVYDASIQLTGNCPATAGYYKGHAYQSYSTGNIYVIATDLSGGQGVFRHLYAPN